MLFDEAAAGLKKDGFAVVRNCVDATKLRLLVAEYAAQAQ